MKINNNILPYVRPFIEDHIDLIENENFDKYFDAVDNLVDNLNGDDELYYDIMSTLSDILKQLYGATDILKNLYYVPSGFFSQTDAEIIIPANVNNVLYNAITIEHAKLLKFNASNKLIKLYETAILIVGVIDCIEFNRPCTISVYDIELFSNDSKIKKFNIFSDIEFKESRAGETFLKNMNKDVEINIKNGVTVKIGAFKSNVSAEIKEYLSTHGFKKVNIV